MHQALVSGHGPQPVVVVVQARPCQISFASQCQTRTFLCIHSSPVVVCPQPSETVTHTFRLLPKLRPQGQARSLLLVIRTAVSRLQAVHGTKSPIGIPHLRCLAAFLEMARTRIPISAVHPMGEALSVLHYLLCLALLMAWHSGCVLRVAQIYTTTTPNRVGIWAHTQCRRSTTCPFHRSLLTWPA